MTQNQYQTLVSCPDCGNTQPFTGTLKPRAHTRCSLCKKDFYVMKNVMPTDYNNNADKQIEITEIDTYTDLEGNIYADSMPTVRRKKKIIHPYSVTFNPTDRSFIRTFHLLLYGTAPGHSSGKGFDYICDKLIERIEEFKRSYLEEKAKKELGKL